VQIGTETIAIADFSHLPTHCRFITFMPQWDSLDFLAAHGKRYPTFHLVMQAEVADLIEEDGRVVGADGRHSAIRAIVH
jgi:2-polyprenyl-6-methoxyphenol hydroxylase-like FAD-dependent oxidoreductase